MKNPYGYFDDANREYVITRPDTPLPWLNYLGQDDFFRVCTNTGGCYTFWRDAKLRRLTRYRYNNIPMDLGGRYLYIRDGGCVWNPGWKPCKTKGTRSVQTPTAAEDHDRRQPHGKQAPSGGLGYGRDIRPRRADADFVPVAGSTSGERRE